MTNRRRNSRMAVALSEMGVPLEEIGRQLGFAPKARASQAGACIGRGWSGFGAFVAGRIALAHYKSEQNLRELMAKYAARLPLSEEWL